MANTTTESVPVMNDLSSNPMLRLTALSCVWGGRWFTIHPMFEFCAGVARLNMVVDCPSREIVALPDEDVVAELVQGGLPREIADGLVKLLKKDMVIAAKLFLSAAYPMPDNLPMQ